MHSRLIGFAIVTILATSCNGSGAGSGSSGNGAGGRQPAKAAGTTLSEGQLRAALLQPADVPSGYTVGTDNSTPTPATNDCAKRFSVLDNLDKGTSGPASQKVEYDKDTSAISEEIDSFTTSAAAAAKFKQVGSLPTACHTLIIADKDGTLNAKVTALDLPKFGDDRAGFNVSGVVGAFPISFDFVIVRVDRTNLYLNNAGLGAATDVGLTKSIATKAIAHVQQCLTAAGCKAVTAAALPTPTVLESAGPTIAKTWSANWCKAQVGMSRDQLRAVMGNPTEEFDPASGTPEMSWDAFEFQFNAFFDVNDKVRQLDVNDIRLSSAEKAAITCASTRTAQ